MQRASLGHQQNNHERDQEKLKKAKGKWVEELPNILWAYQTTPRKATNETPYTLAFGFEVVIPLEVGLPTIHTKAYDVSHIEEVLDWDQIGKDRQTGSDSQARWQGRLLPQRSRGQTSSETLEFQQFEKILPLKYNFPNRAGIYIKYTCKSCFTEKFYFSSKYSAGESQDKTRDKHYAQTLCNLVDQLQR